MANKKPTGMHKAGRGLKQGQWVYCYAEPGNCRVNGGTSEHRSIESVKADRKQARDAAKKLTVPVFGPKDQAKFEKFLEDNGVRATYTNRGVHFPLYNVKNLSEHIGADLPKVHPFVNAEQADVAAAALNREVERVKKNGEYSYDNRTICVALSVASTPGISQKSKMYLSNFNEALEDANYHTIDAYVTAVRNRNGN